MSTTAARSAAGTAPSRTARPGLALLLGILSVPGSTVAWELPSGGYWIGLPLGVAAIVLALGARRAGAGVGIATAGLVLAVLSISLMVVWTAASALS